MGRDEEAALLPSQPADKDAKAFQQAAPTKLRSFRLADDEEYYTRMLFLAKAVYFCIFAADASWEPFAAYVLSKRGMNEALIGALLTAMTVSNACSGQLLTALADRHCCHRHVVLTAFTLFVIFTCALVFSTNFVYTGVVGVAAQICWGPVLPMTDNVTVQLVRAANSEDYSRQRLYAAIAWALFCFGDGWLMEAYGYQVLFYVLALMGLIALVLLSLYPFTEFGAKSDLEKRPTWGELGSLALHNVLMMPFLSIILCTGYLFSTIDGYLALYVVSLGGDSALVGAMYAVASIVEIPLFFWSDRIYHCIGMKWVFAVTSVAYLVRVVSYSLLHNPYLVLLVEPVHALTIALFWGPCVHYLNDVLLSDKPHLKATGQGSFFAAFYSGRAVGYSVAGWLSSVGGLRFMFRSSLVAVGSLMILVANFWRLDHFACGSARADDDAPDGALLKHPPAHHEAVSGDEPSVAKCAVVDGYTSFGEEDDVDESRLRGGAHLVYEQ